MTGVSEEKGPEQNLDHRRTNLAVVGMLSICRTDLKGEIFVQTMVGMLAMDGRRFSCWLYFHTGVSKLSILPAVIDYTALFMVLLRRTFLARTSTVSIPPITWLPKILSTAPWVPMLPKLSPIHPVLLRVFSCSSERRFLS